MNAEVYENAYTFRMYLDKEETLRYSLHSSTVEEWKKFHTRYATEVKLVQDAVKELHEKVLKEIVRLSNRPALERIEGHKQLLIDVGKLTDEITDAMFVIERKEIKTRMSEEAAFRDERAQRIESEFAEKLAEYDAKVKEREEEQRKKEELRKAEESRKAAEAQQIELKKQKALSMDVDDDVVVVNKAGVNKNLLSLPGKLAQMLRRKYVLNVSMAQTKDGNLVLVCSKTASNVRVSFAVRNGKERGSIVSSSVCTYIRRKYGLDEDKEHSFSVKYVEYVDDIKIKIVDLMA